MKKKYFVILILYLTDFYNILSIVKKQEFEFCYLQPV